MYRNAGRIRWDDLLLIAIMIAITAIIIVKIGNWLLTPASYTYQNTGNPETEWVLSK